ncbi:electron transporter [Sphingobacterium sp. ML3W]|uniref:SCO family protein n=1 Tax=Sphingobacterium TaxID=28453 RepID=UPI0004F637A2|nr:MULTISPECIES: SCO family protein [Sphingobacterium]AIM37784.1 electron transporter [Sphingobacterium sp. ML3W]MDH5826089.1 SCO family protein [Sphingobacterium faecium]
MIKSLHLRASFIVALTALSFISCQSNTPTLPIYGQREPVEKIVDGVTVTDTIYHTIPAFQFLNQDSTYTTNKDYDDKVYIANFFFTHCPSICPTMNRNLLKIYEQYKNDDQVYFLSHSIDFKYDQPSVLKEYANKLGVTNNHWNFVTGTKADIYGIANQYLVFTAEDKNAPGGYDHQGLLVLVDKQKRIRGAYDGTNDEQVEKLQKELAILLQEK